MRKRIVAALVAASSTLPVLAAEGDINTEKLTEASEKITTALTTYFNDTLVPLVIAVGGLALICYLILALFRWARRLGK